MYQTLVQDEGDIFDSIEKAKIDIKVTIYLGPILILLHSKSFSLFFFFSIRNLTSYFSYNNLTSTKSKQKKKKNHFWGIKNYSKLNKAYSTYVVAYFTKKLRNYN